MYDPVYEKGQEIKRRLEGLSLRDLLEINPTLGQMRSVVRVMQIGWGKGGDHHATTEVEKMLNATNR